MNTKSDSEFMVGVAKEALSFLRPLETELAGILRNLEYAAYNLCDKTDSDIGHGVLDSTCPETSLFIAIRQLREIQKRLEKYELQKT